MSILFHEIRNRAGRGTDNEHERATHAPAQGRAGKSVQYPSTVVITTTSPLGKLPASTILDMVSSAVLPQSRVDFVMPL